MEERFFRLFSTPENLYTNGSPVIIAAGALLQDNQSGKVLAQLKFKKIDNCAIRSLKIELTLFDSAGRVLGSPVEQPYLDLDGTASEFGSKTPVYIADITVRSISVRVSEVVRSDGSIWSDNAGVWEPLPSLTKLPLDTEMLKQYKIEYGQQCEYQFTKAKDLWICTCGNANREGICVWCGINRADIENVDKDLLREKCSKRLEADRIKAEEAKSKATKITKISAISGALLFCIIAIVLAFTVVVPTVKYNNAVSLMDLGEYEEAIVSFELLDGYKDSVDKIVECENKIVDSKYESALWLMGEEKYSEAIEIFAALGDYSKSKVKIAECKKEIEKAEKYAQAVEYMNSGEYLLAIDYFEALGIYKDCLEKIEQCKKAILDDKYNDAVKLMDSGDYVNALVAFQNIRGYKDSSEKIDLNYAKHIELQLKNVKPGDIVLFGTYEQDNDESNGREYIEWLVLDVKDGKAFVISKRILDKKQYHNTYASVTWETCRLREWLNEGFFNQAFSESDKFKIQTVKVTADKNPNHTEIPMGNSTQDKIFLLSISEVNKYFSSKNEKCANPTAYAKAQGSYNSWILRTQALGFYGVYDNKYYSSYSYVSSFGDINDTQKSYTISDAVGVRPAMWITTD